jgi:hypothetical protein
MTNAQEDSIGTLGIVILVLGLAWTIYGGRSENIDHQIGGYILLVIASLIFVWTKIIKITNMIKKKKKLLKDNGISF